MKTKLGMILAGLLGLATAGYGQTYTVHKPGELPTRIRSDQRGGYTVQRPGELPIRIRKQR